MTTRPNLHEEDPTRRAIRIALAVGILVLSAAVFSPFFSPLLWATVLCYALYPLYSRLVRATGGRQTLSALIMCVIMTIGLIVPLVYLSILIAEDLADTYRAVVALLKEGDQPLIEGWRRYPVIAAIVQELQRLERLTGTELRSSLAENLTDLGRLLFGQLTRIMTNVLYGVMQLSMILLCAFYFFRDGETIVEWIQCTLPVPAERQRLVIMRFDEVIKGAVYGNTLIALLEGSIGGLAFWLVGLPSAVLWGAAMAVLAYLPLVGAGLIWVPAALWLLLQGAYVKVGVLVAAGIMIAVTDYLVRTIVVGSRSRLHTLLVFFSVLGGIHILGLVGIVGGPLVVAVAITLLESYRIEKSPVVTAPS
ncbi:MAG: AI-2E family transporter [Nitrospirota bacterium]